MRMELIAIVHPSSGT